MLLFESSASIKEKNPCRSTDPFLETHMNMLFGTSFLEGCLFCHATQPVVRINNENEGDSGAKRHPPSHSCGSHDAIEMNIT